MTWFLIVALAIVAVVVSTALALIARYVTQEETDVALLAEIEVRRAERRLHDLSSRSFESMLNAARHGDGR